MVTCIHCLETCVNLTFDPSMRIWSIKTRQKTIVLSFLPDALSGDLAHKFSRSERLFSSAWRKIKNRSFLQRERLADFCILRLNDVGNHTTEKKISFSLSILLSVLKTSSKTSANPAEARTDCARRKRRYRIRRRKVDQEQFCHLVQKILFMSKPISASLDDEIFSLSLSSRLVSENFQWAKWSNVQIYLCNT
jgi:hypothetical protein